MGGKIIDKPFLLALCVFLITITAMQCTPGSKIVQVSYDLRQYAEADSLFKKGYYSLAIEKFTKLRDDKRINPSLISKAQYNLGYINIYYDNPFSDYEAALREFKRFASAFPNDEKIDLVNNWIRILTAMKNFDYNFKGNVDKLKEVESKQSNTTRNYTSLQEAYLNCESHKDSLENRVKVLEDVIKKLGKLE